MVKPPSMSCRRFITTRNDYYKWATKEINSGKNLLRLAMQNVIAVGAVGTDSTIASLVRTEQWQMAE